ncbi:zinc finger CCHC domain-containing protein 24-like [Eriocheir sinensis]|uniref:zinc finger CCHC domain-containing protein 24-like n=1 Tax=Eriocheir sinensis TaxID=95602 RepID=UPI0021C8037B|nr:zinc finger CCHC domain-containing protein 24-like [Eriocheir sinensis]XP_050690808.1 zinc finger CCHC domain-containing protein 24-like [Eriocheir sinensis]
MSEATKLTPYQGKRRVFGHYRCPKCNVEWNSANSWANTFQKCKTCNSEVYPYKQEKLVPSGENKERKAHPENLCQRCMRRGRPCWQDKY